MRILICNKYILLLYILIFFISIKFHLAFYSSKNDIEYIHKYNDHENKLKWYKYENNILKENNDSENHNKNLKLLNNRNELHKLSKYWLKKLGTPKELPPSAWCNDQGLVASIPITNKITKLLNEKVKILLNKEIPTVNEDSLENEKENSKINNESGFLSSKGISISCNGSILIAKSFYEIKGGKRVDSLIVNLKKTNDCDLFYEYKTDKYSYRVYKIDPFDKRLWLKDRSKYFKEARQVNNVRVVGRYNNNISEIEEKWNIDLPSNLSVIVVCICRINQENMEENYSNCYPNIKWQKTVRGHLIDSDSSKYYNNKYVVENELRDATMYGMLLSSLFTAGHKNDISVPNDENEHIFDNKLDFKYNGNDLEYFKKIYLWPSYCEYSVLSNEENKNNEINKIFKNKKKSKNSNNLEKAKIIIIGGCPMEGINLNILLNTGSHLIFSISNNSWNSKEFSEENISLKCAVKMYNEKQNFEKQGCGSSLSSYLSSTPSPQFYKKGLWSSKSITSTSTSTSTTKLSSSSYLWSSISYPWSSSSQFSNLSSNSSSLFSWSSSSWNSPSQNSYSTSTSTPWNLPSQNLPSNSNSWNSPSQNSPSTSTSWNSASQNSHSNSWNSPSKNSYSTSNSWNLPSQNSHSSSNPWNLPTQNSPSISRNSSNSSSGNLFLQNSVSSWNSPSKNSPSSWNSSSWNSSSRNSSSWNSFKFLNQFSHNSNEFNFEDKSYIEEINKKSNSNFTPQMRRLISQEQPQPQFNPHLRQKDPNISPNANVVRSQLTGKSIMNTPKIGRESLGGGSGDKSYLFFNRQFQERENNLNQELNGDDTLLSAMDTNIYRRSLPSERIISAVFQNILWRDWLIRYAPLVGGNGNFIRIGRNFAFSFLGESYVEEAATLGFSYDRAILSFLSGKRLSQLGRFMTFGYTQGLYGIRVDRSATINAWGLDLQARYFMSSTLASFELREYAQHITVRDVGLSLRHSFSQGDLIVGQEFSTEAIASYKTLFIDIATNVKYKTYGMALGLRGYQFTIIRDFLSRSTDFLGNWGNGWQLLLSSTFPTDTDPGVSVRAGAGRLGRSFVLGGAGVGRDMIPIVSFQTQLDDIGVILEFSPAAKDRIFAYGIEVNHFAYFWESVFSTERTPVPLILGIEPKDLSKVVFG